MDMSDINNIDHSSIDRLCSVMMPWQSHSYKVVKASMKTYRWIKAKLNCHHRSNRYNRDMAIIMMNDAIFQNHHGICFFGKEFVRLWRPAIKLLEAGDLQDAAQLSSRVSALTSPQMTMKLAGRRRMRTRRRRWRWRTKLKKREMIALVLEDKNALYNVF